jgi:hypothetical protein
MVCHRGSYVYDLGAQGFSDDHCSMPVGKPFMEQVRGVRVRNGVQLSVILLIRWVLCHDCTIKVDAPTSECRTTTAAMAPSLLTVLGRLSPAAQTTT